MNKYNYVTKLGVRFGHLEKIDIPALVNECRDKWYNESLTKVNNSVVRIGIVEGEYHWHKHENDDEFFFVLEGRLFVDIEDKTTELLPHQGITVTKGLMHRTRAPQRTVTLMIETSSIQPEGD
ncbi:MAG TPA: cupin domain-containing protein [Ignavibacteria bacterium]|nr:cupin domain-containing protein [Ignavibacteria bacterium]